MFCARCGQQIPEASEVCPLCGREATLHLEPPPPLPVAQAAPAQIRWPDEPQNIGPPMRRPDLKGVGGWLLFFCVSLTVLAPALMLIRTWGGGFELDSMIDLAFTAFGVFVGIMVWSTNQSALLLLWIYFGLAAALLLLGLVGTLVSEQPDPQLLGQLFRGLLSTVLWFAYFKKSDRVQATFGRNL